MATRKRKPKVHVEERVTRAEEQLRAHSARSDEHYEGVIKAIAELKQATSERLDAHDGRLQSVENKFTRYEGAWGFVTIVLSSLAAAWAIFGEFIKKRMGLE